MIPKLIVQSALDESGRDCFDVSYENNGEIIERRVLPSTLLSILSASVDVGKKVKIPLLPPGVLGGEIEIGHDDNFSVILHRPAQKTNFIHLMKIHPIPMPSLIAKVEVKNGTVRSMSLFITDTDTPKEDSPLYLYPFGNVSSSGGCCLGNLCICGITDISKSPKIFEEYFLGDGNGDLLQLDHFIKSKKFSGLSSFLDYLETLETFNNELLVQSVNFPFLRDLI